MKSRVKRKMGRNVQSKKRSGRLGPANDKWIKGNGRRRERGGTAEMSEESRRKMSKGSSDLLKRRDG